MTDCDEMFLRDRIVAAILTENDIVYQADAVMRELGLRQQFDSGSTVYNTRLNSVHIKSTRWVTEWTTDKSSCRCACPDCCSSE